MKKAIFILLAPCFASTTFAREQTHEMLKHETAWFLAELYYGSGHEYKKILKQNNLKSPEELSLGKVIIIKDPKFYSEQPGFQDRYDSLRNKQRQHLAEKAKAKIRANIEAVIAQGNPAEGIAPTGPEKSLPSVSERVQIDNPLLKAREELNSPRAR